MKIHFDMKLAVNIPATMSRLDPQFRAAQAALVNAVLRDSDQYTPFRTGMLARSGQLGSGYQTGIIEYRVPYARRMYYGIDFTFNKTSHPMAQAQWFEKAKSIHLRQWAEIVQQHFT